MRERGGLGSSWGSWGRAGEVWKGPGEPGPFYLWSDQGGIFPPKRDEAALGWGTRHVFETVVFR
jgi:hypothetical protein